MPFLSMRKSYLVKRLYQSYSSLLRIGSLQNALNDHSRGKDLVTLLNRTIAVSLFDVVYSTVSFAANPEKKSLNPTENDFVNHLALSNTFVYKGQELTT